MRAFWPTAALLAASLATSGATAQGAGQYTLQQLPMELQQLSQPPRSATSYCDSEAAARGLAADPKHAFVQACLGRTMRADPFAFVRCRQQTTGLEGKDYLDRFQACLLASGGQRD
jgi:hypothetical protein